MLRDDLAYPAMLVRLPPGLLGLVATSLVASYMSTISTMLNWGSSYVVNDLWLRFVGPRPTSRTRPTRPGATTAVLMVLAGVVALQLQSVYEGFQILLKIGAGTGPDLHPPMVLVAPQCRRRDRRDGDLLRPGDRLLRDRPNRPGPVATGLVAVPRHRLRDDGRLAPRGARHPPRIRGDAPRLLPPDSPRWPRLARRPHSRPQ